MVPALKLKGLTILSSVPRIFIAVISIWIILINIHAKESSPL